MVGNRISGCRCGRGGRLLLVLLSLVPFSLLASADPRGKLQTGLRGERLLQNLEDSLDLQRKREQVNTLKVNSEQNGIELNLL